MRTTALRRPGVGSSMKNRITYRDILSSCSSVVGGTISDDDFLRSLVHVRLRSLSKQFLSIVSLRHCLTEAPLKNQVKARGSIGEVNLYLFGSNLGILCIRLEQLQL